MSVGGAGVQSSAGVATALCWEGWLREDDNASGVMCVTPPPLKWRMTMWTVIGVGWLMALLFAWALCRAAARGDEYER